MEIIVQKIHKSWGGQGISAFGFKSLKAMARFTMISDYIFDIFKWLIVKQHFGATEVALIVMGEINISTLLQAYGYNLDWRGWGTSEYCFTPNRPFHWSLISTGEGMLTGSRVLCFDPVKIPSPVEIRDQWDGLFGVKRYSDVPHPLQSRLQP